MSEFNDQQTIARLYPEGLDGDPRRALMRNERQTGTGFCQWCADPRATVNDLYLVCLTCDRPRGN